VAKDFLKIATQYPGKLIEPPFVVESDTIEGKVPGKFRELDVRTLKPGTKLNYVLDVAPRSFKEPFVADPIMKAKSIFVNAVMGFTPHFNEGTKTMYLLINQNKTANKMFGGGDTLQEFRTLLPGTYIAAVDDPQYYFFSGGGTILKAIHEGCVTGLAPVRALIDQPGML
jgi:phosphoglycerate kinase